jgi:hypothetical protein
MNYYSFLAVVYRVVPFVPGLYALWAYLARRPASRRGLWIVGLLVASILPVSTTVQTRESGLPLTRLIVAWTILFALPVVLSVATVDGLRRTSAPRWLGVFSIVAVYLLAQFVAAFAPVAILDLVQASG